MYPWPAPISTIVSNLFSFHRESIRGQISFTSCIFFGFIPLNSCCVAFTLLHSEWNRMFSKMESSFTFWTILCKSPFREGTSSNCKRRSMSSSDNCNKLSIKSAGSWRIYPSCAQSTYIAQNQHLYKREIVQRQNNILVQKATEILKQTTRNLSNILATAWCSP